MDCTLRQCPSPQQYIKTSSCGEKRGQADKASGMGSDQGRIFMTQVIHLIASSSGRGFSFWRGGGSCKRKRIQSSASTGCRRRESPGSLVAVSVHKFSPQISPGDPGCRRLKAFSKSCALRGARIQYIVNPTTVLETQSDVQCVRGFCVCLC